MRLLRLSSLCFCTCLSAHQTSLNQQLQPLYSEAIQSFNAGRLAEAKSLLEKLLTDHPDYYRGYSVYWDSIGRTQNAAARRAAAERDLKRFERAPIDNRDQDFYSNFIAGYKLLSNTQRIAAIEAECLAKFPRGTLAQSRRLSAARESKQTDPVKSAALYTAYLKDFDDNISWTSLAARDRFRLIASHPELFDSRQLVSSAEESEYRSKQYIAEFGNPAEHFGEMVSIVEALLVPDPESALNYARRGLAFVQEQWPRTDEIKESSRVRFWPLMMRAHLARKEWKQAAAFGDALVKEVETATAAGMAITSNGESKIRLDYANALEHLGSLESARVQREVAASPGRNRERREQQIRDALMARRIDRPAPPFELKDLNGNAISLAGLRGKAVVIAFWATWCGPCIGELDELKDVFKLYTTSPEVAILTVSTDSDKDAVPKLAKERGYSFPILLSDGTVEEAYKTHSIPQLYVIDPAGAIRFHETGYTRDGYYRKKLDWMIEAVLRK